MKLHSNIPFDDDSVNLQFPMSHAFRKTSDDTTFVNFKAKEANGNGVVLVFVDYNQSPSMFIMSFHDGKFIRPATIVGDGSIEIINNTEIKVNVAKWSTVCIMSNAVVFE